MSRSSTKSVLAVNMVKIDELAVISSKHMKKLTGFGITSTERLLLLAGTRIGREDLAEQLDIPEDLILRWIHQAEMIQIKGIGGEYSHMLLSLGVDCVSELRQSNPKELYRSIAKTNYEKLMVRRLPSQEDVERWVKQAKRMKAGEE
jgi:hypothetical protein